MLTASHSTKSKRSSSTAEPTQPTGRFAPSPTGPLHLGSLLAATASYLDARARQGRWLVRFDDLDEPRNQPGAETSILRSLENHGLVWDGTVSHQRSRVPLYLSALEALREHTFYCSCSRRVLRDKPIYPGTCRDQRRPRPNTAIRIRVPDREITFTDLFMGPQRDNLAESTGDFVVRRRDGLIAYQLATAVDDGEPAMTHVIRGRDLLDNTARQIFLMQLLDLEPPVYGHVPLLVFPDGQKLSKQQGAAALDDSRASENLALVMTALGIDVPARAHALSPAELLDWGIAQWQPAAVARADVIVPR